jgi:tetratricopeptide (TPR) repeat protein
MDAAAWGPRAHRAITGTAIQVIRRTYPNTFKTEDYNYEDDVLQGAIDGARMLNNMKAFASESEAVAAVDNEIRLLREVRKYGVGSYFSYHMGMLGALLSDLLLPYGLDTGQDSDLRASLEADVDSHLDKYTFAPQQRQREFIFGATEYLAERRTLVNDNRVMVADDYRKGTGYNGFMKEAGPVYFGKATEAVADAWHSVLKINNSYAEVAPSRDVIGWYFVNEIKYLLERKKNMYQATKAYENFMQAGKNMPEALETIGDLFYDFGNQEGRDRGVREWRIAYDMTGSDRRDIGKKLASHFVKIGEGYLTKASRPNAADDDLPNALNAFTEALQFDQTSDLAAKRINETNTAISQRKERRQLNVNIIASAEKVKVQAEKKRLEKDFASAIDTYKQAIGLYEAIDDEFKDQNDSAKNSIKEINKNITDVINEILDAGSDAIDQGDKLVDEKKFEDAKKEYQRVQSIIDVVPGDEKTTHGKNKKEMLDLAQTKIKDADVAKQRFEALERERQEQAKNAARGGGAAPAAAAPRAPVAK